jgi:uncharacterized protein (UPF0332 family)
VDPHVEGRVRNRIARARAKLATAERLLQSGDWDDALSRAYYAAFHAAQALLLTVGLSPRTHEGTLSLFGLHFVKSGRLEAAHARALREIKEDRENGDYAEVTFFEEQEARARVQGAVRLVHAAIELLEREHGIRDL